MREYKPRKKNAELFTWLLERVVEVPYEVSVRWCFYRLVQERGLTKQDYENFIAVFSRIRKNFWNGWTPYSVIDESRSVNMDGDGHADFISWIADMKAYRPTYEKYSKQDEIVMICYEAEAMSKQFEYYAAPFYVPMAAFKGDPSIFQKWEIARNLAELYMKYGKPVRILYFGDYEPLKKTGSRGKGLTIPINAIEDIEEWFIECCLARGVNPYENFERPLVLERVGLNREHIERWHLPENPLKPGEYQWEALSDEQARALILTALNNHLDRAAINAVEQQEETDHGQWEKYLERIMAESER